MSRRQYKRFLTSYKAAGGWDGSATMSMIRQQADVLISAGVDAPTAGKLLGSVNTRNPVIIGALLPVYGTVDTRLICGDELVMHHRAGDGQCGYGLYPQVDGVEWFDTAN